MGCPPIAAAAAVAPPPPPPPPATEASRWLKGDFPAFVVEEDDEKGAGDGWERWPPAPVEWEEAGAAGEEAEKEAGVMADVEVGGRGVAAGL